MREKNMALFWGKYIKSNPPKRLETYEMKFTKKKRIAYDAVAEHQVWYLDNSKKGLYYKIPDMASADGYSAKKPFDSLWMVDAEPFVVVWFYKPRQKKVFHKIHLARFLWLKANSKFKSFTEEDLNGYSEAINIT